MSLCINIYKYEYMIYYEYNNEYINIIYPVSIPTTDREGIIVYKIVIQTKSAVLRTRNGSPVEI